MATARCGEPWTCRIDAWRRHAPLRVAVGHCSDRDDDVGATLVLVATSPMYGHVTPEGGAPARARLRANQQRMMKEGAPRSVIAAEAGAWLYSLGMTARIGAKGQVVIPKSIRDQAQLHPGDEVEIELDQDRIVIAARRQPSTLGGRFANSGMASRLLQDRRREPR